MRWRVLILLLAVAVARGGEPRADDAAARPIDPAKFDPALLAKEIFKASNRVREQHGVPGLWPQSQLDAAADDQATMMAMMLYCERDNPLPAQRNAFMRVEHRGLQPRAVAENAISVPAREPGTGRPLTYQEAAQEIVTRWMNSPGHRANLLRRGFSNLGCAARVATVPVDQPMVFATQVFGLLQ